MTHTWISFADEEQNLGIAIVEASAEMAPIVAGMLGINPGGEALCAEIPDDMPVAARFLNRLMTRHEAEEVFQEQCPGDVLVRVNSNMEPQDV